MQSGGWEANRTLGRRGAGPKRRHSQQQKTALNLFLLFFFTRARALSLSSPPQPSDLATLRTVPTTAPQVRAYAEAAGRVVGVPRALGVAKPASAAAPVAASPAPAGGPSRARGAAPILDTTFDACPDQDAIADFFAAKTGVTFTQGLAVNLTDSWGWPCEAPTQWMVAAARTIPDNPKRRGLILSAPAGFTRASFIYSTYATIAKFKPAEYGVIRPTLSLWAGADPGGEGELLATVTLPLTNETYAADRTPIMWNFKPAGLAAPAGGRKAKSMLLTGTVVSPTMGEDVFYLPTYIDSLKVWA